MWQLKSYLLPSDNYRNISIEEALLFGNIVKEVCKKDLLIIPNEFYSCKDINNISATEYLFNQNMDDASQYILDIVTKQRSCTDNYADLMLNVLDIQGSFACLVSKENTEEIDRYIIKSKEDIVKVKRVYIALVDNYDKFKDRAIDCYPNLIFHNEAFNRINKLGDISDVIDELMRHLEVLCDYGKEIYLNNSEKDSLANLKSEYNIICSGKGSNEELDFNKKIVVSHIEVDNGIQKEVKTEYDLTCNPHTKFYDGRNDQRIYFCWGRSEISDHNIIIVRIGDHWK